MRTGWIIVTAIVAGCSQKTERQKFIDYINDPEHKIIQQISIGGVQATTKWLAPEYRSLKNPSGDLSESKEAGFHYFDVKFDKLEGDKPGKEKLLYLNFDMHKDFVLLTGQDSIAPAICQKIESGIPGCYQYLLAFERNKKDEDRDFILFYYDKIFSTGTLAFVYQQEDIKKIPKLKEEDTK